MIGQTVSHYRITRQLGAGGMGIVYEALDNKLDRKIALKFLPPEATRDPEAKARFIQEAKAASALDHPNVCTIYEVGETENGQLFIAMACYEGETLKEIISRGPLPLEDVIDITQQVARGLAKSHEQGIIHRDIKPANIFVTSDGLVKILDFGLAKLAGQTRLTRTGSTLGTVAYMSPEQARGEASDHRADIWSLGVTLYEMVTGQLPFKGEYEALVYSILNETAEPLTGLRTGIPLELERIINKCLAKDPGERYQSAQGLLSDLNPLQKTMAQPSEHTQTATSQRAPGRVNSKWLWVVTLVFLGIVLGVTARKFVQQIDGSRDRDRTIAVIDFSDLADPVDQTSSATLTSLVNTSLTEHSPIRVISPSYQRDIRRRLFGSGPESITADQALEVARRAGASLLLTGEITQIDTDRNILWRLTDTETGENLAAGREEGNNLLTLADLVVGEVLPWLAATTESDSTFESPSVTDMTTRSEKAYQYFVAGMLAREEGREQDELRAFQRAVAIDTTFALAFYELSRSYGREHGLARYYADKAWSLRSKLGFKDYMRLETWRHWVDYRIKDVLAAHREMLVRWPDDREVIGDMLTTLYANWYTNEVLEIAERGLELYPNDMTFGLYYWLTLSQIGRFDEALAANKNHVHRHPQDAGSHDNLGALYFWMGQPDSAEAEFQKSLELDPTYVWAEHSLGHLAFAKGDLKGAIEAVEKVLERQDLTSYQQLAIRTQYVNWFLGLAFLYAEAGRLERAYEVVEEAKPYAADPKSELRRVIAPRHFIRLRTGQADKVLHWARQAKLSDIRVVWLQAIKYETLALVALDSLASARVALAELSATEEYWGAYTQYMINKISALISLAENDPEAALTALEALSHYPSPGGMYDIEIREALARAHRLAGRLDKAAAVHREMLRVYGGHALSHYELGGIYEELGRFNEAKKEYTIFLEMWFEADEDLPQFNDAKQRLELLKRGS